MHILSCHSERYDFDTANKDMCPEHKNDTNDRFHPFWKPNTLRSHFSDTPRATSLVYFSSITLEVHNWIYY